MWNRNPADLTSALGLDFIHRVKMTSGMLGLLVWLFVSVYADWRSGLGILLGTAWGVLNFHFLTELVVAVVTPDEVRKRRVVLLALIKFPALYGAGYLFLAKSGLPIPMLLMGFSLLFAVAVLKVLGRLLNEHLAKSVPPNADEMVR